MRTTLDLLQASRRPVIFIGHGMTLSEAGKELTEFVRKYRIPVISSPNGMGCLDMRDPLSLGFIGRNGAYPANQAGRHADLVIAIGARFDDRSSSSWMPGYSWNFPASKLVHVDVDHAEIGRNYAPDLGILADARTFLRQLLGEAATRRIDGETQFRAQFSEWQSQIAGWRAEWEKYIRPNFEIHATPIRPERIVADCRAVLPDDAIISLDSGIHHNWFMQFWEARQPQTMLNTWGYSGMGFGPSSILGAKLAAPDRPCVSICGDGGFTMVSHVLCTAVEYDIPAVWVVWNNFAWAAIRDLQYAYFERPRARHRVLSRSGSQAVQPGFRGVGARGRRRGAHGHQVAGLQGRARARREAEPALPDRRARRREHPAARHRCMGAAADSAHGADLRQEARAMKKPAAQAIIRNVVETPWQQYPGHFGGALSKPLVRPETAGSRLVDYRISTYQPMAYVETHSHKVQEQIYHVLEGEGSMEIEGKRRIVRKHDVIFIPPGVSHSICNNGLTDLTFIVVTTPVEDR